MGVGSATPRGEAPIDVHHHFTRLLVGDSTGFCDVEQVESAQGFVAMAGEGVGRTAIEQRDLGLELGDAVARAKVTHTRRVVIAGAGPVSEDGVEQLKILVVSGDAADEDVALAAAGDLSGAAADDQVAAAAADDILVAIADEDIVAAPAGDPAEAAKAGDIGC